MKDRTKVLVTAGLMVGLLVAALDQTIVDTAFPKMISDLGGVAIFTWVITAYMLASTAVVPVIGKLADIFGRKIFYLLGLVLFVGGSVLCGAAMSMTQLIIYRGIQGLGAGMLMPITFTLIGDLFPGEQRAKMQGLFGGVWGLASIMGPKLGGWITHNFSWRYVFYVNVPIGILAFVLILIGLKESRGQRRPIDYLGSFTITSGIVFLLLALLQGGSEHPWNSAPILSYFGLSALLLVSFVFIERRAEEPVINFSLFKDRTVLIMNLVALVMGMGMFGCIVYVPWFVQGVVGVDPNTAGNVMTPMMLTVVVFSVLAGRLAMKIAYRLQISIGFVLLALGFFLMTKWTSTTTQLQATLSTLPVGAGLGMMMPLLTLAVQNAVPANLRGQVTSMSTFFRSTGATIGLSIFGVIFNSQMGKNEPKVVADFVAMAQQKLLTLPATAIPPEMKDNLVKMFAQPQGLVQMLLQEKIRTGVGAFVPPQVFAQVVQGIKDMMSSSLHIVFFSGIAVVGLGFLVTQFMGTANLKRQIKDAADRGEQADLHAAMAE